MRVHCVHGSTKARVGEPRLDSGVWRSAVGAAMRCGLTFAACTGNGVIGLSPGAANQLAQERRLLCVQQGVGSKMKLGGREGSGFQIGEVLVASGFASAFGRLLVR